MVLAATASSSNAGQVSQRAPSALQVEDEVAVVEDDVGAGRPARRAIVAPLALGQGRAAPYGLAGSQPPRARPPGQPATRPPGMPRTQTVDGPGQRELGATETLDEVAAAHPAALLHLAVARGTRRRSRPDALGQDRVPGHDAVALQERARQGSAPLRGRRLAVTTQSGHRAHASATSDHRPAASGGPMRDPGARPGWPGTPIAAPTRPAQGAQRRERVVAHLACPDQVPESVQDVPLARPMLAESAAAAMTAAASSRWKDAPRDARCSRRAAWSHGSAPAACPAMASVEPGSSRARRSGR